MKSTILAAGAILVAVVTLSCNNDPDKKGTIKTVSSDTLAGPTTSTESKEGWTPVDSATATKAMWAAGTPGKEQAELASADGNWKAVITMWEKPNAAPMVSTGMLANKMIMNGRYQQMSFKGDMMGMTYEGTGTTGFDNARKVWVTNWVDNMSTGIMNMEGTWDAAGKSITYKGQMLCPANGKMCEVRQVITKVDDKNQLMEMYGPDMQTGKLYKNMEMKLTRS